MIYGITMSNGEQVLDLDQASLKPVRLGYQLVHNITGRMLPMTFNHEVYSAWAATEKMGQVALDIPTLDIFDYVMKPIYEHDKPKNCKHILSMFDGA